MAAGDVIARTINADGRSATFRVEGVAAAGTYLYDAANNDLVDTATAKIVFTVTSDSFDATGAATTVQRTVYGVATQRDPGTANPKETVAGSDLDIVFALSEPIYNDDTATVTLLSAWYTKTGVPSAAGSNLSVTNSSALDYFVPFGQWDILPAERVTGNFRVAFTARHLHGIACVKFTALGATSAHSQTATATAETTRERTVSGLFGTAHEATIAIAGFTQGEQIDLKAEVFPLVGDTEMDTADNGSDVEATGRGPRHVICDKNDTARKYAFVTVGAGGGTASTTLATAQADPFPTIVAARNAMSNGEVFQIYLNGAAHSISANMTASRTCATWCTIEPAPGNGSTVVVTINSAFNEPKTERIKFKNVQIKLSGTTSIFYGVDRTEYIAFENCTHDANSFAAAEAHVDFLGVYYKDCTFDDGDAWDLRQTSSDKFRFTFDGCVIPTAGKFGAYWRVIACQITACTQIINTVAAADVKPTNELFEFNEFMNYGGGDEAAPFNEAASKSGMSFIGNIIEGDTSDVTPTNLIGMCDDSAFDIDHIIFAHNTIVGERSNIFYNSEGTTAYFSRGVRHVGNIHTELDTKHDDFGTPSAARIGRWWFNYGTCSRGNLSIQENFEPEYPGLRFVLTGDPDFTDDQTAAAGGGDYSLGSASDAIGLLAAGDRVVPYDLYGTAIPNDGTGAAGAVQVDAVSYEVDDPVLTGTVGVESDLMTITITGL